MSGGKKRMVQVMEMRPWRERMRPMEEVGRLKPPVKRNGRRNKSWSASGVERKTGKSWSKVMVWLFGLLAIVVSGRVESLV